MFSLGLLLAMSLLGCGGGSGASSSGTGLVGDQLMPDTQRGLMIVQMLNAINAAPQSNGGFVPANIATALKGVKGLVGVQVTATGNVLAYFPDGVGFTFFNDELPGVSGAQTTLRPAATIRPARSVAASVRPLASSQQASIPGSRTAVVMDSEDPPGWQFHNAAIDDDAGLLNSTGYQCQGLLQSTLDKLRKLPSNVGIMYLGGHGGAVYDDDDNAMLNAILEDQHKKGILPAYSYGIESATGPSLVITIPTGSKPITIPIPPDSSVTNDLVARRIGYSVSEADGQSLPGGLVIPLYAVRYYITPAFVKFYWQSHFAPNSLFLSGSCFLQNPFAQEFRSALYAEGVSQIAGYVGESQPSLSYQAASYILDKSLGGNRLHLNRENRVALGGAVPPMRPFSLEALISLTNKIGLTQYVHNGETTLTLAPNPNAASVCSILNPELTSITIKPGSGPLPTRGGGAADQLILSGDFSDTQGTVTTGGKSLEVTSWSPTEVDCELPTGGAGDVVVNCPLADGSGVSATNARQLSSWAGTETDTVSSNFKLTADYLDGTLTLHPAFRGDIGPTYISPDDSDVTYPTTPINLVADAPNCSGNLLGTVYLLGFYGITSRANTDNNGYNTYPIEPDLITYVSSNPGPATFTATISLGTVKPMNFSTGGIAFNSNDPVTYSNGNGYGEFPLTLGYAGPISFDPNYNILAGTGKPYDTESGDNWTEINTVSWSMIKCTWPPNLSDPR